MVDGRPFRRVTRADRHSAGLWRLTLRCGHDATLPAHGPLPAPARARCNDCPAAGDHDPDLRPLRDVKSLSDNGHGTTRMYLTCGHTVIRLTDRYTTPKRGRCDLCADGDDGTDPFTGWTREDLIAEVTNLRAVVDRFAP